MTAQSAGLELPELPLHFTLYERYARGEKLRPVYTADQMREYGRQCALAAAPAADGWVLVPRIGTEVAADHPITCLNPTPTFDVVAVEVDSLGARARGENTCWFGVSMLAAAPQAQGEGK